MVRVARLNPVRIRPVFALDYAACICSWVETGLMVWFNRVRFNLDFASVLDECGTSEAERLIGVLFLIDHLLRTSKPELEPPPSNDFVRLRLTATFAEGRGHGLRIWNHPNPEARKCVSQAVGSRGVHFSLGGFDGIWGRQMSAQWLNSAKSEI
ncbi:hypothetical protein Droror1_Dr00013738 [Drosera rotundifolia]